MQNYYTQKKKITVVTLIVTTVAISSSIPPLTLPVTAAEYAKLLSADTADHNFGQKIFHNIGTPLVPL